VRQVIAETARVTSLVLDVPEWPGHLAGQHVDVRLTAEDGYQVQRSYSIASAPASSGGDAAQIALTVARIDEGEVSPFLTETLRVGDRLELRGPIGGYFVWTGADAPQRPLQLLAGGSGIVPLMAMLRHRARLAREIPARLLYSSRTWDAIIYRDELSRMAAADARFTVTHALTRETPPSWTGQSRHVDGAMLRELALPPSAQPDLYVCGPTPFVESVADALLGWGHSAERIKTERFGPTGPAAASP
jgi:ferredoxin-NADP reductase